MACVQCSGIQFWRMATNIPSQAQASIRQVAKRASILLRTQEVKPWRPDRPQA